MFSLNTKFNFFFLILLVSTLNLSAKNLYSLNNKISNDFSIKINQDDLVQNLENSSEAQINIYSSDLGKLFKNENILQDISIRVFTKNNSNELEQLAFFNQSYRKPLERNLNDILTASILLPDLKSSKIIYIKVYDSQNNLAGDFEELITINNAPQEESQSNPELDLLMQNLKIITERRPGTQTFITKETNGNYAVRIPSSNKPVRQKNTITNIFTNDESQIDFSKVIFTNSTGENTANLIWQDSSNSVELSFPGSNTSFNFTSSGIKNLTFSETDLGSNPPPDNTLEISNGKLYITKNGQRQLFQGEQGPPGPAGASGGGGATTPGGSNTQIQFNNSGTFGGATGLTYAASGNHVTVTALAASNKPLVLRAAPSQTANLQEWQDSAGTVLTKITAAGIANFGNGSIQGTAATFRGDGTNSTAPGQFVIQATGVSNENCFIDFYNSSSSLIGRMVFAQTQNTTQIQHGAGFRPDLAIRQSDGLTSMAGSQVIYDGRLNVGTNVPSTKGLVVRGAATQTANLQEWQDSTGTILGSISGSGVLNVSSISAIASNMNVLLNATNTSISSAGLGPQLYLAFNSRVSTSPASQFSWSSVSSTASGAPDTGLARSAAGAVAITNGSTGLGALITGAPTASTIALTVRGAAAQTANLQEWQNSAGTVLASVSASGNLNAGSGMFSVNSDINQILVSPGTRVVDNITAHWQIYQGFQVATGSSYSFSSSSSSAGIADTAISRNSAGVLEVNSGTLGQYRDLIARRATLTEAMRLTPQSSPPASPALGDLYVDSDSNELCFYNGGAWVAIAAAGACS